MESPTFLEIIQKAQQEYNTQNVFVQTSDGRKSPAIDFIKSDWKDFLRDASQDKDTVDRLCYDYQMATTTVMDSLRNNNSEYAPGLYVLSEYYFWMLNQMRSAYGISIENPNGRRLWNIEQKKIKKAQDAEARKKAREAAKVNPVKDMLKYLRGRSEFCEKVANYGNHPTYAEIPTIDIVAVRASAKVLADKYYKAAVSLAFAHVEGKGLAWAKEFAGYDPYGAGYALLFRFDISMKKIIRKYGSQAKKDAKA